MFVAEAEAAEASTTSASVPLTTRGGGAVECWNVWRRGHGCNNEVSWGHADGYLSIKIIRFAQSAKYWPVHPCTTEQQQQQQQLHKHKTQDSRGANKLPLNANRMHISRPISGSFLRDLLFVKGTDKSTTHSKITRLSYQECAPAAPKSLPRFSWRDLRELFMVAPSYETKGAKKIPVDTGICFVRLLFSV